MGRVDDSCSFERTAEGPLRGLVRDISFRWRSRDRRGNLAL